MWIDNASKIDMLFYKPYTKIIMDILQDDKMSPTTVGLFGSWGSGKSSMLNFIQEEIEKSIDSKMKVININAWQIENYEDAKIAIIESFIKDLEIIVSNSNNQNLPNKIKEIMKKINWLKFGGTIIKSIAPIALSHGVSGTFDMNSYLPPLINSTMGIELKEDKPNNQGNEIPSTVKTIREIRSDIESLIKESGVNKIIVCIDDLDRCLPNKIIEMLEAIKLFLSVTGTVFIIAVDERLIRYAIDNQYKSNFAINEDEGIDSIASDYIEKIIQIPVHIPTLSNKDIQNYLMMLVLESNLTPQDFQSLLAEIKSKKYLLGADVISKDTFCVSLKDLNIKVSESLSKDLDVIEEVKNVVSTSLKGNPRQAKRFLNAFQIKKKLANQYFKEELSLNILAKLLVLSMIDINCFNDLFEWSFNYEVNIQELEELVNKTMNNEIITGHWGNAKIKKWLLSAPRDLYKSDLTNYFYLTRELNTDNANFESKLTEIEKQFIGDFISLSNAQIESKKLLSDISTRSDIRLPEITNILKKEFNKKSIELNKMLLLSDSLPKITEDIIDIIITNENFYFTLANFGYLKHLYNKNIEKFKKYIDSKDGKIYKEIRGEI